MALDILARKPLCFALRENTRAHITAPACMKRPKGKKMAIKEGDNSPWGEIDYVVELVPELAYSVTTPSHGGIMIKANSDFGKEMSDAAWDIANTFGPWLCFEEDLDYVIAYRELYRQGYMEQFDIDIQRSLEENPDGFFGSTDTIIKWFPAYAEEMGLE